MPSTASGDPESFTVVIAGGYNEFSFWCRKHDLNPRSQRLKYAMDLCDIMGLDPDTEFVFYGTYVRDRRKCELADEIRGRCAYYGNLDKIKYEVD